MLVSETSNEIDELSKTATSQGWTRTAKPFSAPLNIRIHCNTDPDWNHGRNPPWRRRTTSKETLLNPEP